MALSQYFCTELKAEFRQKKKKTTLMNSTRSFQLGEDIVAYKYLKLKTENWEIE